MKTLLTFLFILPYLAMAQTGQKNFIDQNYIEVTGKSEMEITPDLIYLRIVLSEKDDKSKVALAEREKAMLSKLQELGIDISKDLAINDISSRFKTYLISKSDIWLSKEYQLVVKDGLQTSKVFIELEKIGISNVSIAKLDNSSIEKFRKEVKADAIKAAKSKAESLTNAINQNIGRAIYVQELDNNNSNRSSNSIMIRGVGAGTMLNQPDVEFEKIKIEYSILCRFELK